MRHLFVLFFLLITIQLKAQQEVSLFQKRKWLFTTSDTIFIDSLPLIPSSLRLYTRSNELIRCPVRLSEDNRFLILLSGNCVPDTFRVAYQIDRLQSMRTYKHRDFSILQQRDNRKKEPLVWQFGNSNTAASGFSSLNRNGSISRGIVAGNNQDLVVNSNLNLQLSGKISPTVSILAAISDDNLPIQAEGNTQQLQEFDRVFIQLFDDNTRLTAGDFQISRPASHFMNYYKRGQGGWITNTTSRKINKDSLVVKSEISGAVSRGKFSRNIILGIEGNQGPYRLTGAANELFIIVLSGSERIYIDGELMIRGQENDYIIDYNTAEIIFTARRLITKDRRIVAEFQYADRNYARALWIAGSDVRYGNTSIRFHHFTEGDNRKRPLAFSLNDEQKRLLGEVGDSVQFALYQKVDTLQYTPDEILYAKVDTLIDGIPFSGIFVNSTNPELAVYRPAFSFVGQGKGNYIRQASASNGRVFTWIAPVNGMPQGDHEPIILIPAPIRKSMNTLGVSHKFKRSEIGVELAHSVNDVNTYSAKDSDDDNGLGVLVQAKNERKISNDSLPWIWRSQLNYELVNKSFAFIERYRSVEFERDWNRADAIIRSNQHLLLAQSGCYKNSSNFAEARVNSFTEDGRSSALMGGLTYSKLDSNLLASLHINYLSSTGLLENSNFLRYKARIQHRYLKAFRAGASAEQEQSRIFLNGLDSLARRSFSFFEWQAWSGTYDTTKTGFELRFIDRLDWLPLADALQKVSKAQTVQSSLLINKKANSVFRFISSYRTLQVFDTLRFALRPDETFLGRVEYQFRLFKQSITGTTFYEGGSGQELRREYSFIEVAPGQGTHSWRDYNGDGVTQLDEFEVAVFTDQAKYLKIFTPTNTFIRTINNQFSQVLNLSFPSRWSSSESIVKKNLQRFSNQVAFRTEQKQQQVSVETGLNPFNNPVFDDRLIQIGRNFRNTLYFNRLAQKSGIDFTFQDAANRLLVTNGFEARRHIQRTIKTRYTLADDYLINFMIGNGLKLNKAEFFSSRDFTIRYTQFEPRITWQPGVDYKVSAYYLNQEKSDFSSDTLVRLNGRTIGVEAKYNEVSKGSIAASVKAITYRFSGDAESPLGFEMLEGFLPGRNFSWSLSWQRNLANNLQLNLSYEGRKTEATRAIHTGGLQIRAFF